MKSQKLLTSFLFFIAFTSAYSQYEKGDISLSIQGAPFITQDGPDDLGLMGLVTAEFFILPKLSAGISFFTTNNTVLKNDSGTTIHSYGVVPSMQYYVFNKNKFNAFAQIGYGYGFEDLTRGYVENSALTVFNVGIGSNYNFSEHWMVKLTIPYFKAHNVTVDATAADGATVFIGFGYKL
ncbi:outer membrane beta-barrel protein [Marixanthomonas spongiae]|uniref:Uncharacterized protein n=1 Tax=Marixanthomonas spongiae TaxID=2174845 RepID=A0A2U0I1Y2_9FLAO|nr:outer membrane beta-barrel protein [Marixanthomonas spongiae]PVW15105.1 hypothetical protein DDV96_06770 [Marixanthomonas spongiae]